MFSIYDKVVGTGDSSITLDLTNYTTFSDVATPEDIAALEAAILTKANTSHSHYSSDIADMTSQLDALKSYTHEYFSTKESTLSQYNELVALIEGIDNTATLTAINENFEVLSADVTSLDASVTSLESSVSGCVVATQGSGYNSMTYAFNSIHMSEASGSNIYTSTSTPSSLRLYDYYEGAMGMGTESTTTVAGAKMMVTSVGNDGTGYTATTIKSTDVTTPAVILGGTDLTTTLASMSADITANTTAVTSVSTSLTSMAADITTVSTSLASKADTDHTHATLSATAISDDLTQAMFDIIYPVGSYFMTYTDDAVPSLGTWDFVSGLYGTESDSKLADGVMVYIYERMT